MRFLPPFLTYLAIVHAFPRVLSAPSTLAGCPTRYAIPLNFIPVLVPVWGFSNIF
jgi:hypothetical protein